MKILHVLFTPRSEGTPNLVLDWLEVPGCIQEVFVLHHQPADLTRELRGRATWYGEAGLLDHRGMGKFLRLIREMNVVCRERRPDLIVCWYTGFANWLIIGARLALGWRVRFIAHCGNPPNRGLRDDLISLSVLWPLRWLRGVCACCSNYVRDLNRQIPGLSAAMFATVYNCARIGQIHCRAQAARATREAVHPPEVVGIMVATLEAHKDHATLLRALPEVRRVRPDFRLWLVGAGSLRPSLEKLAEELGVAPIVRFVGASKEVPEWLGRADLFIFSTTLQEGFGSVLLEALAAGLPIVATDCPACREVLADGRYGGLVPAMNADALAEQILHSVATLATHDQQPGYDYAAQFTPRRMLNEYLHLAGLPPTEPTNL